MFGFLIGVVVSSVKAIATTVGLAKLSIDGLKEIAGIIKQIGIALGIIKEDTNLEELGDKALQAEQEGIKPENFKTYDEYVRKIETFELDPEKSKKLSPEEKNRRGIEVMSGMVLDAMGPNVPMQKFLEIVLANNNRGYFESRIGELSKAIADNRNFIGDIVGVLSGSEKNAAKVKDVVENFVQLEKNLDNGMSAVDVMKTISGIRNKNNLS